MQSGDVAFQALEEEPDVLELADPMFRSLYPRRNPPDSRKNGPKSKYLPWVAREGLPRNAAERTLRDP